SSFSDQPLAGALSQGQRADEPRSLTPIARLFLTQVGLVVAERGQFLIAHHIVRAGPPAAHVDLAGHYIGNQAVAVLADQPDFLFGAGDGTVQRLALVGDPAAD